MFLTFTPLISLNLVSFFVAFGLMLLEIHVGLTLVAVATLPFTYLSGSKLRNISFPMSWIVQDAPPRSRRSSTRTSRACGW